MSSWDKYFYDICKSVASKSRCLSRQIGAVIVRDKSIISTGYNGPPRGIPHCDDPSVWEKNSNTMGSGFWMFRGVETSIKIEEDIDLTKCPRQYMGYKSGEGLNWCFAGHAERNAIINAARLGISTYGTSLYCNCGVPCKDCLSEIINAGVMEIICLHFNFYDVSSKYLIENSNISLRILKL
jgi:dCMP deaminase